MIRRAAVTALLVATSAALLAACGADVSPASGTGVSPGEGGGLDGDWTLASATVDQEPLALKSEAPVTLIVYGSEVSGRSACNSYTGVLDVTGETVAFSGLGGTDMGCERDVMALETAYLQALGRVVTAVSTEDELTLTGDGVELAFIPGRQVEAVTLVGTQWLLESLVTGSGPDASVSSVSPAGRPSFLKLSEDGTFEGEGGCNHVSGTWHQTGDIIETADIGGTEVGCEGDAAELERQVFDVLAGPFTAVVEGDTLTLAIDDGRGLVYRPAP